MTTETQVGPLAREDILNEVDEQVQKSVKLGAKLVLGGYRLDKAGYFYSPTILTDITKEMPVYYDETFGPVFTVFKFDSIDEMIEIANDSDFGLGGSLWSDDRDKALSIARKIETGAVFINDFTLFSNSLFDASVKFLESFKVIGWDYTVASVVVCVIAPIVLLLALLMY